MGELNITYGSMFSGKTGDLIRVMREKHLIKKLKNEKYLGVVVSFAEDKRDIRQIKNLTTHDEIISESPFPPDVEFISSCKLEDVKKELLRFDHISIDESQFFPDLVPVVKELLNAGKFVHCAGLIADSDMVVFGSLLELFPLSSHNFHKKAYCVGCCKEAAFTKYIGESKKESQKKIGADVYIPSCRKCHAL
jgi:thymidine kinase